jgi:TRAP-type C4-dicarboxylate transport system permease small subunit
MMQKSILSMKRNSRSRAQKAQDSASLMTGMQSLRRDVDLAELATGAFVATMCLIGNDALPWLFAQARDIVQCGIAFECFGTLVLGLFADHAMLCEQRTRRIVWLTIGVALAFICGVLFAIMLLVPGLIVGGVWLLKGRLQCPEKLVLYSREHCYVIRCVALAAWLFLLLAVVLMLLLTWVAGTKASGESASWVYAITWGGFYLALATALPIVRRRATQSPRLE